MEINDIVTPQHQTELLEALKLLRCSGEIKFFEKNLFSCLLVDNEFGRKAVEILKDYGFDLTPTQKKRGAPQTHLSLLNSFEQDKLIERKKVTELMKDLEKKGTGVVD